MGERFIAGFVAVAFVTSNFLIIFLVIILYLLKGFTFEETTTTVAILGPVFAAYTAGIIRFAITHRDATTQSHRDAPQTYLFSFISIFVTSMFIIAIIALVILRATNAGITSFDQFKILLGIVQSLFAGYVALLVGALFGPDAAQFKPASGNRPPQEVVGGPGGAPVP
jgi:hypothetical protein